MNEVEMCKKEGWTDGRRRSREEVHPALYLQVVCSLASLRVLLQCLTLNGHRKDCKFFTPLPPPPSF